MKPKPEFDSGDFCWGTWRILDGDAPMSFADIAGSLGACIDAGIQYIDTAEIYGGYTVEEALGKAINTSASFRSELGYITKSGIDVPSIGKPGAELPHYNATAKNLIQCAEKSITLMGLEALDLYLVHRPDWLTHPEDTAYGLSKLLESGKVKNVGVSNYTRDQFQVLDNYMDGRLVTNQVEFSPFHMEPIYNGTFDQCLDRKIRPMAWSPLGGGEIFSSDCCAPTRELLEKMSSKYDEIGIDALIYLWILAVPVRPSVILGTSKVNRIKDAMKAKELEMDRQDWYSIWQSVKGAPVP